MDAHAIRSRATCRSALAANLLYLQHYALTDPSRLVRAQPSGCTLIGNVVIAADAQIDPTARIGPDVAIGPRVRIGSGVRVRNAILLGDCDVRPHACIINAVLASRCIVGAWARIEGAPLELHMGRRRFVDATKRSDVAILANDVDVAPEIIVRQCIVLPNKQLSVSYNQEILL